MMSARPALRRILLASLTTLAACASLPGVHGFSASTSGPASATPPATASAPTSSGDQSSTFAGSQGFEPSHVDPATSWQTRPETEARRDENGGIVAPGPSANGFAGQVDCSAAHNHCLHTNTWFVSDLAEPAAMPRLAFRFEGQFYSWRNSEHMTGSGETAYQTVPATPENTKPGSIVVFYLAESPDEVIPAAGQARTDSAWRMGTVKAVDAADGTFRIARGPRHGFARARVVVASQPMP
ncbi:MAG: hypothetical protein K8W52_31220 [Deltaproteobacteria bacterium]|nr:hypothetical protein [Deltaproteobacteria bacterium]